MTLEFRRRKLAIVTGVFVNESPRGACLHYSRFASRSSCFVIVFKQMKVTMPKMEDKSTDGCLFVS